MELHYILVVLVIIAIIVAQIYIYRNTKKKIATYKSIFPNSTSSYSIVEKEIQTESCSDDDDVYVEDIDTISVSQLNINTDNETLKEIRDALNMYLQKNLKKLFVSTNTIMILALLKIYSLYLQNSFTPEVCLTEG
jgi:flagellar basal body-associated protein FliL